MSEVKVNKISPRSGTTVTLGDSGDTVTIPSGATINNQGTATNFGATGSASWSTTVITADPGPGVAGVGYFTDTSGSAFNVTLPASPSAGAVIAVADYANNWGTNAVTLLRNGSNIEGNASDFICNTKGAAVTFVYVDATKGWVVTDTGNSTDVFQQTIDIHYTIVGGGGGGGSTYSPNVTSGGGGGAGGFLTNFGSTALTLGSGITYTITVGTGGAGAATSAALGTNGGNSVITGTGVSITATGGGAGSSSTGANGADGGSGGGGGATKSGGSGNTPSTTPSQGNDGGSGGSTGNYGGGGGGGAAAVGANGTGTNGGNGGNGSSNSITGSAVTYAGGGGGGNYNGGTVGSGGTGGGGNAGANSGAVGGNGTDGLGGGGGGASYNSGSHYAGGDGGNGVVIVRMTTTDYSAVTATGTFTTATDGSDTIITWTASPATLVT